MSGLAIAGQPGPAGSANSVVFVPRTFRAAVVEHRLDNAGAAGSSSSATEIGTGGKRSASGTGRRPPRSGPPNADGRRSYAVPGRCQRSLEEAAAIRAEIDKLLDGGRWTDRHGASHQLTLDDILIVAPYNAQVRCLKAHLPAGARVGTVDKFQGQQVPIVLLCEFAKDAR